MSQCCSYVEGIDLILVFMSGLKILVKIFLLIFSKVLCVMKLEEISCVFTAQRKINSKHTLLLGTLNARGRLCMKYGTNVSV